MLCPDAVRQPVVPGGIHGSATTIHNRAAGCVGIQGKVPHRAGSKIENGAQRIGVWKWHVAIDSAVPHPRAFNGDAICVQPALCPYIKGAARYPDAFALRLRRVDAILDGGRIVGVGVIGDRAVADNGKGVGRLNLRLGRRFQINNVNVIKRRGVGSVLLKPDGASRRDGRAADECVHVVEEHARRAMSWILVVAAVVCAVFVKPGLHGVQVEALPKRTIYVEIQGRGDSAPVCGVGNTRAHIYRGNVLARIICPFNVLPGGIEANISMAGSFKFGARVLIGRRRG